MSRVPTWGSRSPTTPCRRAGEGPSFGPARVEEAGQGRQLRGPSGSGSGSPFEGLPEVRPRPAVPASRPPRGALPPLPRLTSRRRLRLKTALDSTRRAGSPAGRAGLRMPTGCCCCCCCCCDAGAAGTRAPPPPAGPCDPGSEHPTAGPARGAGGDRRGGAVEGLHVTRLERRQRRHVGSHPSPSHTRPLPPALRVPARCRPAPVERSPPRERARG